MKTILLVALLIFVLASVHSVSTGRDRVERQAPAEEAGDGDNDNDDDDDDDDDEEDPPETPDTLAAGQPKPQQVTREKVASHIQSNPGIDTKTKQVATTTRPHWSGRHTHRQAHRQNHQKRFRHTHYNSNRQNPGRTQYQSPGPRGVGKILGTTTSGRTFHTGHSQKVNVVSNTKPSRGTVNPRTIHTRRRHNGIGQTHVPQRHHNNHKNAVPRKHHNTHKKAVLRKHQNNHKKSVPRKHHNNHQKRHFNWRNRGLKISQPRQTLPPVTPTPTSAPVVTRSWDQMTRQVSPQPLYTTPPPPAQRHNAKTPVVRNRWNNNRVLNSNRNTGNSFATGNNVNRRLSKTISKSPNIAKFSQQVKQTSAKSPSLQRPNNRFNQNQKKPRFQARNQWHSQRQQQSSSGGFASQHNQNFPVSINSRRQSPSRKEFIASPVQQSKKPDRAVQNIMRSPVVLSSPNSQTNQVKSPSTRFSNVMYRQHATTIQRNTPGTQSNDVKYGNNGWKGALKTGVTWSEAGRTVMPSRSKTVTSNTGLSANNKNAKKNAWNGLISSAPSLSKHASNVGQRTKQTSAEQSNKRWTAQPATASSLSTSIGRSTPKQTQVVIPNNQKVKSYTSRTTWGHQINPQTQQVYETAGNSQTKKQMYDSSVSKSSRVESPTRSSFSSGFSKTNAGSSHPKSQQLTPTIQDQAFDVSSLSESVSSPTIRHRPTGKIAKGVQSSPHHVPSSLSSPSVHVSWTSESSPAIQIKQQASTQAADTNSVVSASSLSTSKSTSTWASTQNNRQQHQQQQSHHQQQQRQLQRQKQQQHYMQQHQQQQQSPVKNAWMSTSDVPSVQDTQSVVQSVIAPALESQPSGQLASQTVTDGRDQQQSVVSSSSKTWTTKSSSASAASYVPSTSLGKPAKTSSITHDIPIPSFEAMGLAKQPSDTWAQSNGVELSSQSPARSSPQIVDNKSQNTVPSHLARHLIRESVAGHVTKTKVEKQPTPQMETVSTNPTTNGGSTFDHISFNGLTTRKPLIGSSDSQTSNQYESRVSQNVDSPTQSITHGVKKASGVVEKSSKDTSVYAPTLTVNGGQTDKPSKTKPVVAIASSNSPPSAESPLSHQQPYNMKGTKEVESASGTGSPTDNMKHNLQSMEQLRAKSGFVSSVNTLHNDGIAGMSRHTIGSSASVTGTSQSTMSGQQHQQQPDSVSSLSAMNYPETVNNFPNLDTTAPVPNTIRTTEQRINTQSANNQGLSSDFTSGTFPVKSRNTNDKHPLSQPQQTLTSGFVSISEQNNVQNSFNDHNSGKAKTIGSDVTSTKDNIALLSQQSKVLHHNIDVIQPGTNSINQGGASLSMVNRDGNNGNMNIGSVMESRHSQNKAYETTSVIQQVPSGNNVVEHRQDNVLQPKSFIDVINKEMAAQNSILPAVNQVKTDRVVVAKRNEWDKVIPSIPTILASMGRPKVSFGVDPGHTVQAIKRVPAKATNKEVAPAYNTINKDAKISSGSSALDVALGTIEHIAPEKQYEKTSAKDIHSGKSETNVKPKGDYVKYNTVERRQSQTDPIQEVQGLYNLIGSSLPNVGQAPFNVGLPGDQVYTPTSSVKQYQQMKESQPAERKNLAQDSLLGGNEVSHSTSNGNNNGPLYPFETSKKAQDLKIDSGKPQGNYQLHPRHNEKKVTSKAVVNTDIKQNPVDARPMRQDSAVVSSAALSQPGKGTTQSVGVLPTTTVTTTALPFFSTRKMSHNVLLERLFDYATIVTTTPTPVNRNTEVVYAQMRNGPFVEEKTITKSINEKWRPLFNANRRNIFTNRETNPNAVYTLGNKKRFTANSRSQSLVSYSNMNEANLVASSHNKVRKVNIPGWNADYSVANSLSRFGELDLKLQSTPKSSSSTRVSGTGSGNGVEASDKTKSGSSIQRTTVKPIVSGTNGKSLTDKIVTSDTALASMNNGNGNNPATSVDATTEAPAANSLSNPSGGRISSGDSSSISLMALEYGTETTKQNTQQPKPGKQVSNQKFPGHHGKGFYFGDPAPRGLRRSSLDHGERTGQLPSISFKSVRPNRYVRGMTRFQTASRIRGKDNVNTG